MSMLKIMSSSLLFLSAPLFMVLIHADEAAEEAKRSLHPALAREAHEKKEEEPKEQIVIAEKETEPSKAPCGAIEESVTYVMDKATFQKLMEEQGQDIVLEPKQHNRLLKYTDKDIAQ